jgi:hypothetical protein
MSLVDHDLLDERLKFGVVVIVFNGLLKCLLRCKQSFLWISGFTELQRVQTNCGEKKTDGDVISRFDNLGDKLGSPLVEARNERVAWLPHVQLLQTSCDTYEKLVLVQFLVGVGLSTYVWAVETEQDVYQHQQLSHVRLDEVFRHVRVGKSEFVNLLNVQCGKNTDLGVELESVVSPGVASLAALAEPPNHLVHQQVRVEAVVEVDHFARVLKQLHRWRDRLEVQELSEVRHQLNSSWELPVVHLLLLLKACAQLV